MSIGISSQIYLHLCHLFMLQIYVFQEVNRILLGLNCAKALETNSVPESAKTLSSEHDFDLQVGIYLTVPQ